MIHILVSRPRSSRGDQGGAEARALGAPVQMVGDADVDLDDLDENRSQEDEGHQSQNHDQQAEQADRQGEYDVGVGRHRSRDCRLNEDGHIPSTQRSHVKGQGESARYRHPNSTLLDLCAVVQIPREAAGVESGFCSRPA